MSVEKMREALEKLAAATDKLLGDMRERAMMRGDYDTVDGRKIAILDCGCGVLSGVDEALEIARAALAEQTAQGEVAGMVLLPKIMTPAMRRVVEREEWEWADVLAAAGAVTEAEYEAILTAPPAPSVPSTRALIDALRAGELRKSRSKLIGWTFTRDPQGKAESFWGKTPVDAITALLAAEPEVKS